MATEVIGFDTIKTLYVVDDDFWEIVEQFNGSSIGRMSHVKGDYSLQDGYLFKGRKLCIPIGSMRENISWDFHNGGMARHFGKDKKMHLVANNFYWPKIKIKCSEVKNLSNG